MINIILKRIRWNGMSELQKRRHVSRMLTMLTALNERYLGIRHPEQIRLKHCFWLKDVWMEKQAFADTTKGDYLRSLSVLVEALGREPWQRPLGLAYPNSRGGRPRKLAVVNSRSRRFKKP